MTAEEKKPLIADRWILPLKVFSIVVLLLLWIHNGRVDRLLEDQREAIMQEIEEDQWDKEAAMTDEEWEVWFDIEHKRFPEDLRNELKDISRWARRAEVQ